MDKIYFIPRYLEYAESVKNIININVLRGNYKNSSNIENEVKIIDKSKFDLKLFKKEIKKIGNEYKMNIKIIGDINYQTKRRKNG